MKRALIWTLALVFLAPTVRAADSGWPAELSKVHGIVKANFGDIPFHRVKVRREGNVTDVSIKLKSVPRQFRSAARKQAGNDDLFLATNFLEFFEPDFDTFSFNVFPGLADFFDYYYGFVALNFGKTIKRRAEITVTDGDSVDVQNVKKKLKLKKNTAHVRFVEDVLQEPGLYLLYTEVGPYSMSNFFCTDCS